MSDREDPDGFPIAVREAAGSPESFRLLRAFAALVESEAELRGLMGPRELPRLWSRHIVNSMAVNGFIPRGARVADLGSGAGFPGVVVAICRPDTTVTLIESMERRTEWLRHAVAELGLRNVAVVTSRAEALHGTQAFDVVTARAVAALDRLVPWALPLVVPGGALVAMKGERAADELKAAHSAIARWGGTGGRVCEVPSPLDGTLTRVVVVERGVRTTARARD